MLIDVHAHTNWLGMTTDDWAAHFRRIGVDRVWLLACVGQNVLRNTMDTEITNEDVMDAAQRYPDLFIPFCAVLPWEADAIQQIERFVELGCRGYGEHKIRLCIDNPDSVRVFQACGEMGLPVLFHMDVPLPSSDMWFNVDLARLPRVMEQCPKTIFIGHGPAFWREISGDAAASPEAYPSGPVTPGGLLPRLLDEWPNLYCDLSAGSGLNAVRRDPEFGPPFLEKYSHRILYGTDYHDTAHIEFLRGAGLSPEAFERITHLNAESLVPVR
ncbi:MAG TPA: amidohydrolase family protein [Armatimonadota bacterium]|nr:amidohydrolase family protein [Armatimonadota bacterium]